MPGVIERPAWQPMGHDEVEDEMRRSRTSRAMRTGACLAVIAITAAACTPPPDGSSDDQAGDVTEREGCEEFAEYGDLSGTTVTVYTAIAAPEDEPHMASYEPFEECTGATVEYDGSREFTAQLPVRLQSGSAPDIAYIGQPGFIEQVVADYPEIVVPAPQAVQDNVEQYYTQSWIDYASVGGVLYGTPVGASVKSLVWYSPSQFAENGYEIPQTWDELIELSDQIVADGGTPWCAGFGAGEASGWPATDWLEDLVLRTAGPDAYDQWVSGELSFDSAEIAEALEAVGSILKNPDYVNAGFGDVRTIASTDFNEAGFPILRGECSLHRQASFY